MRTTATIDDEVFNEVLALCPNMKPKDLFNHVFKAYLDNEARMRLIRMGGKAPNAPDAPPRRCF